MNQIHIDLKFKGEGFFVRKFAEITGLDLEVVSETGEPAKYGPLKGKPSPRGFGILSIESGNIIEQLTNYLNTLVKNKTAFEENKLDKIIIEVEVPSDNHDSIILPPNVLNMISQLSASIIFSTYKEEKTEEKKDSLQDLNKLFAQFKIDINEGERRKKILSEKYLEHFQNYNDNKTANLEIQKLSDKVSRHIAMWLVAGALIAREKNNETTSQELKKIFLNE